MQSQEELPSRSPGFDATPTEDPDPRRARAAGSGEGRSTVPDRWFEEAFGAQYLRLYRRRTPEQAAQEVEFALTQLGLPRGATVLDVGCGAGRHLKSLLSRGFTAVGVDLSQDLLEHARQSLRRERTPVRLVRADMRFLPLPPQFDAVFSFFTSFGYFFEEEENHQVIREVARVLRPGGRFLIDLMDREWVTRELVEHGVREQDGIRVEDRRWIAPDGLRVEKETTVGIGPEARRFHESVRMYSLAEIRDVLTGSGLVVDHVSGDFRGSEYDPGRVPRMVIFGSRSRGQG